MPVFQSEGIPLAFIDEIADAHRLRPVLLLHGFASHIDMNWRAPGWISTLTGAGYRVVALDHRGHGRSAKLYDVADYGVPVMAVDVVRLLDHLGIEAAHVIGYSMGARIAAQMAIANPDRVTSLVFGGLGYNMVRGMAGTGPIAQALEVDHITEVTNPTARTFRAFAEQTGSDLKALAACIRASRSPIAATDVAGIAVPALVAVGTGDVIGGDAGQLAALMPRGQAFEIVGRDHMKAVGDRTFKDKTLGFLEEVERNLDRPTGASTGAKRL